MIYVTWDPVLVGISYLVAFIASFIALDSTGKISGSSPKAALFWRIAGGITLGIGIWSMHFIGMLAMKIPMMMSYDLQLTLLSLLVVLIASTLSINIAVSSDNTLSLKRYLLATAILSTGMLAMHYLGMGALMMHNVITWNPVPAALSVVIAIVASGSALWLAFCLRLNDKGVLLNRTLAAMLMGFSITAMHYTGMSAADFHIHGYYLSGGVNETGLFIWVSAITMTIFGIMLVISMVDSQIRTTRLTKNLQQVNYQLERQAHYDGLTGLANRSNIDMRLERCLEDTIKNGTRFGLVFMDLDRFKLVNDAWGHHVGDHLLISVANRLSACLSTKMVLARLGGDEFILMVPETNEAEMVALAEEMVSVVQRPFYEEVQIIQVSLSAGVSLYPEHGDNLHVLKLRADTAMYNIKQQGRNGWAIYHEGMAQKSLSAPEFLQDLIQALDRKQFELWYQPKYHVINAEIVGFEALLRWHHPTKGILLPALFLPMLEKTGLILPVGEWVLDTACHQIQLWQLQGHKDWTLSVNLSALQFDQQNIASAVSTVLERYQIPPSRLTLEITESIALKNMEHSEQVLEALSRLGVSLSIDDFNIGYSNMLMLESLPTRELKINRSFIQDINGNSKSLCIIATIIDIAQAMNMKVVAEGVETEEQQQLLTSLGCGLLQGALFSLAIPAELVSQLPPKAASANIVHSQKRLRRRYPVLSAYQSLTRQDRRAIGILHRRDVKKPAVASLLLRSVRPLTGQGRHQRWIVRHVAGIVLRQRIDLLVIPLRRRTGRLVTPLLYAGRNTLRRHNGATASNHQNPGDGKDFYYHQ